MTAGIIAIAEGHLVLGLALAAGGPLYILLTTVFAVLEQEDSPHHTAVTVGDILLISSIVWLTGGVDSEYYLLYYLPVAVAGLRLDSRDGIAACILVTALYSFVTLTADTGHAAISAGPLRVVTVGLSAIVLVILFSLLNREVGLCDDLRETLHNSLSRVAAVYDVAHAANIRADLAAVLSILLDHAARATGAANGSISLLVGGTHLQPMASLSTPSDEAPHPIPYPSEPAHEAIATGSPVTITAGPTAASQPCAIVYVPLITPGGPIGVLSLVSHPGRKFARAHLEFLKSLGSEAALAVENAQLRSQLHQLAITDYLTGLPNRREIEESLAAESARCSRYCRPLSVLMIDVDNLKVVNDKFGHSAGDEVLRALGQMLETSIRSSDSSGRLGGDEFLVVLPETNSGQAAALADGLIAGFPGVLQGWSNLRPSDSVASLASLSVGVAGCDEGELAPKELTSRADAALYAAKRAGKNRSWIAPTGSHLAGTRPGEDAGVTS